MKFSITLFPLCAFPASFSFFYVIFQCANNVFQAAVCRGLAMIISRKSHFAAILYVNYLQQETRLLLKIEFFIKRKLTQIRWRSKMMEKY